MTGEVGGPAALFVLVVVGAFFIPRLPDPNFTLYVRLSGEELDRVDLTKVTLIADLGIRRQPKSFDESGQLAIEQVPSSFINQEIAVRLRPGPVRLANPQKKALIPPSMILDLPVVVQLAFILPHLAMSLID
jgi:hypothetical protein